MQDLIVIGAGLSGLALARAATARGLKTLVLEARPRIGGRILSHRTEAGAYDLGPAWVWPAFQPRIAHIIPALGLHLTEQTEAGGFIFQDQTGHTQRLPHGFAQEPPSMRITGGITALVEAVATALPHGAVLLSHSVRRIALAASGAEVVADREDGPATFQTRRVALALPPRLIAELDMAPALPAPVRTALAGIPGWMAGQAKALALYDRPFWRDHGLSGSAFSQSGPLGELHDATLPDTPGEAAIFGFFGWPPSLRNARHEALPRLVARQLGQLFGPDAAQPREIVVQDWSQEAFTATAADQANGNQHPDYRPLRLPAPWNPTLLLAGAEMAPAFGGYLEGALAAAEAAATML